MQPPPEVVSQEEVSEFVSPGTYVAVAAKESTQTVWVIDPFWIIKVISVNRIDMENDSYDSFGFMVPK